MTRCCRCQKIQGPKQGLRPDQISDGICRSCWAEWRAELGLPAKPYPETRCAVCGARSESVEARSFAIAGIDTETAYSEPLCPSCDGWALTKLAAKGAVTGAFVGVAS